MKRAESAKRIRPREIRKLAEDMVACEARVEHGPELVGNNCEEVIGERTTTMKRRCMCASVETWEEAVR